jgi:hypothetical protein
MQTKAIIGALFFVLPATALASGSVSLTVLEQCHTLEVHQTFRKMLKSSKHAQHYYASVHQEFAKVASRINVPLAKSLNKLKKSGAVPQLTDYSLRIPLIQCRRGQVCPKTDGKFPALLEFTSYQTAKNDRRGYKVVVAFKSKPSPKGLKSVQSAIKGVIDRYADKEGGDGSGITKLKAISLKGNHFELNIRPGLRVSAKLKKRYEKELASFGAQLSKRLSKLFADTHGKKGSGISFAGYEPSLPHYGDSKQIPARTSAYRYDPRYYVQVLFALWKLSNSRTLSEFRTQVTSLL